MTPARGEPTRVRPFARWSAPPPRSSVDGAAGARGRPGARCPALSTNRRHLEVLPHAGGRRPCAPSPLGGVAPGDDSSPARRLARLAMALRQHPPPLPRRGAGAVVRDPPRPAAIRRLRRESRTADRLHWRRAPLLSRRLSLALPSSWLSWRSPARGPGGSSPSPSRGWPGPGQELLVLKEYVRARRVVVGFFALNNLVDAERFESFQRDGGAFPALGRGWKFSSHRPCGLPSTAASSPSPWPVACCGSRFFLPT